MKLGIDVDGVLADWYTSYIKILIRESGKDLFPTNWAKELYKTFPAVWDFEEEYKYTAHDSYKTWQVIKSDSTFWLKLDAMAETDETLRWLNTLSKRGEEVYFLTNRMGFRAKHQTEKWLYDHGMDYPTVILIADKAPLIRQLGINFFVDDKLETVNDVARVAAEDQNFPIHGGIYLKNAPYNQQGRRVDIRVVNSIKEALQAEGIWKE